MNSSWWTCSNCGLSLSFKQLANSSGHDCGENNPSTDAPAIQGPKVDPKCECIAFSKGLHDTHGAMDMKGDYTFVVDGKYIVTTFDGTKEVIVKAGDKLSGVIEVVSEGCGVFFYSAQKKARASNERN